MATSKEGETRSRTLSSSSVVKVSEPRTESGWLGMKKYVTYRVVVTLASTSTDSTQNFDVRRRFSDFLWLRTRLVSRFGAMWVPAMPPKNVEAMVGVQYDSSLSGPFITYRIQGLRVFLNRVLDSTFLRDDTSVVAFLSEGTSGGWSAAKKKEALPKIRPIKENMSGSGGSAKWLRSISNIKVPDGPALKLQNYSENMNQLLGTQKSLNGTLQTVSKTMKSVKKAVSKLQDQLSAVASSTKDMKETLTSGNSDVESKLTDMDADLVQLAMAQALGGWEALIDEKRQQLDDLLARTVDDRMLQTSAILESIREHEKTVNRHTTAWKSKDKCQFAIKQAEDRGMSEKLPKLRADLDVLTSSCQLAKKTMDFESAAVLRSELPRFCLWSLESTRLSSGQYADAQAKTAKREEKVWAQLLDSLGVDFDDTYADAQKSMANTVYGNSFQSVFPPYPGMASYKSRCSSRDTSCGDAASKTSSTASAPVASTTTTTDDHASAPSPTVPKARVDSPTRPPRPARKKVASTEDDDDAEEVADAMPIDNTTGAKDDESPTSSAVPNNDSGIFFDPEPDVEGEEEDDDDGIFI